MNDEGSITHALYAQEAHTLKVCVQIITDMSAPDFLASQEAKAGWNVAKQMILEAIQDKADRANQKCKGQSHD